MRAKRIDRIIVLYAILAIAVALLANQGYAPCLALYLVGRAGRCDLTRSVSSVATVEAQKGIASEFRTSSRLLAEASGFQLWRTRRGDYWIPKGSDSGFFHTLAEEDRQVYGSGRFGVQPGDVVLDGGANVGVFTREALDRGASLVVAIEPVADNIECLRRNFATQISSGRVVVYPRGVWDQDDVLPMWVHADQTMDSFVGVNSHSPLLRRVQLPLTTIDKLIAELALQRVDFIKLDVEGAEKKALTGARLTLAKCRPRLAIAAEHLVEDQDEIPRRIESLQQGYIAECGPCVAMNRSQIGAEVFYFHFSLPGTSR